MIQEWNGESKYKNITYKSQDMSKMYQQYNTSIHIIAR